MAAVPVLRVLAVITARRLTVTLTQSETTDHSPAVLLVATVAQPVELVAGLAGLAIPQVQVAA
jgi:hypothetical protein